MAKYRIQVHGEAYGTWYKVQKRIFLVWITLSSYIDSYESAQKYISQMKSSEEK